FFRIANKMSANKIVLAHNLNDNAETVLMRLTRGSSFEGYRGILPVSKYKDISIIRPILSVSREEIVDYQQKYAIKFNEDSSNSKSTYTRNRFRHTVLPFLEKENPKFLDKFKQFSEYQTMSYELINNLSNIYLEKNLVEKDNALYLDVPSVLVLDRIVQIEVIKKVINKKTDNTLELSYQNINDVLSLINNQKPHISINLDDNLYVYKSYDNLIFTDALKEFVDYEFVINEYQEILLPDNSLVIITNNPNKYYGIIYKLCYNNLDLIFPISIRNRRNGDKVLTAIGTKKVKDMFINKKIPMVVRNKLPIVLGKNQEILWIPNIFKAKTTGNKELYIIYQEGKTNA
ncbi:MAG: tRNA lysidine(34) synthetase TilS, partial [Tenericutes bacterium]|nr:tRNA lysidine(34) synthetase TilS [Mycoplasmatota bacterium]